MVISDDVKHLYPAVVQRTGEYELYDATLLGAMKQGHPRSQAAQLATDIVREKHLMMQDGKA